LEWVEGITVRLSVNIPNFGDFPETLGIGVMAREAENAGADGVWLADHLLLLDEQMTGYPYTEDGIFPAPGTFPFYESLASCAYVAAVTTRCRIGIGVLVLPQRNVLELAKAASTIDRLSGGRFVLGVGTGWNGLEMEALGYSFASRGERMNEMLQVLRSSWSGSPDAFEGKQLSVRDKIKIFPLPAQPNGVPLLVGGMANIVLRRAATLGDGWVAIADVAKLNIDKLGEQVEHVQRLRKEAGDASFDMVLKLEAEEEFAHMLPQAIQKIAPLGFNEVVFDVPWSFGVDKACSMLKSCRDAID
jgi:probable F420-dependent oxidoreductase